MIFPSINDLPDDAALFTGYGQSIRMTIQCNPSSDFICQNYIGNAAPDFTLSKMSMVKVYSKLDQPRADLILKSAISLPLVKYTHRIENITGSSINAIYSVSKTDMIRGLWFAFHTLTPSADTAKSDNVLGNLINDTATQFKNPLSYFPQIPI